MFSFHRRCISQSSVGIHTAIFHESSKQSITHTIKHSINDDCNRSYTRLSGILLSYRIRRTKSRTEKWNRPLQLIQSLPLSQSPLVTQTRSITSSSNEKLNQVMNVNLTSNASTILKDVDSSNMKINTTSETSTDSEEYDFIYRQLDVTKHNFLESYEDFMKHIDKAAFISIDFEFSGLELSASEKNVYNESIDIRYEKIRKGVQRFAPLQLGVCLWELKEDGTASSLNKSSQNFLHREDIETTLKNQDAPEESGQQSIQVNQTFIADESKPDISFKNINGQLESELSSVQSNTSADPELNGAKQLNNIDQLLQGDAAADSTKTEEPNAKVASQSRQHVEGFPWMQRGNITGKYNSPNYIARSYNFNIFPKYSKVFLVESSTLEFLVNNNFDFNKMVRDGIPFLNEVQALLKQQEIDLIGKPNLQKYSIEKHHASYPIIQDYLEEVQRFRSGASLGEVRLMKVDKAYRVPMVIQEILKKYSDIYPEVSKGREIYLHFVNEELKAKIIDRVKAEKRLELEEQLGITRIVQAIIDRKIPIACHNGLFDLLYLYHHFIRPLPLMVSEFKKRLTECFPIIYDTKYIATSSKGVGDLFTNRKGKGLSLGSLYELAWGDSDKVYASSSQLRSQKIGVYIPKQFGNCANREVAHEAGYDAYMTGVVMLQLLHNVHRHEVSQPSNQENEFIFKNRIPIASANYLMNLEEP